MNEDIFYKYILLNALNPTPSTQKIQLIYFLINFFFVRLEIHTQCRLCVQKKTFVFVCLFDWLRRRYKPERHRYTKCDMAMLW